jgi:hypothetical protein
MSQPQSEQQIERLLNLLATGGAQRKIDAANQLAQLRADDERVVAALERSAASDSSPYVRDAARRALVALGHTAPAIGDNTLAYRRTESRARVMAFIILGWSLLIALGSCFVWAFWGMDIPDPSPRPDALPVLGLLPVIPALISLKWTRAGGALLLLLGLGFILGALGLGLIALPNIQPGAMPALAFYGFLFCLALPFLAVLAVPPLVAGWFLVRNPES